MALPSRYGVRSHSRRIRVIGAVGAILAVAAASGCGFSPGNGEPPCFPPPYSVKPSSAKAGEKVTVTAPDADCNPRYGQNARIQVTVTDATGVKVIDTTAPMNDAGGFGYTFDVPVQTAAGKAAVTAMPYNIDWCDDTGRNNRVDGAAVFLQQTSCAMPIKPLNITR
jgi:hypothetical protein